MAQDKDVNAGPRSRQIRSDIDRTRAGIDRTLSELEHRLTAKEIAFDMWGAVRRGSSDSASRLWRAAQDYPLPATMIAVGVGWMLYESSRAGEEQVLAETIWTDEPETGVAGRARQTAFRVADRASQAATSARETASRASEAVSQAAADAAESVRETAATARERATRVGEGARQTSRRLRNDALQTFNDRPLVVGAAGLALGLMAGLLAPRSQREDELLGESRDRLVDTARERGRDVLDKGRRVAEVATDAAKSAAVEVGQETKAAVQQEVGRQA